MISKRAFVFLLVAAGCSRADTIADNQQDHRQAAKSTAKVGEEIVFITPSRTGTEVRAVAPDGSRGRRIFKVPEYASENAVIWDLNASPDGKQIAFSSDHDWDRSYNFTNVYVVDADGTNLRRPSDAPSIPQLDDYKTGRVQVVARRLVAGGDLSVYVQGAREPATQLLREREAYRYTLQVADFGPEIYQMVRVYDGNSGAREACAFDPAVRADVRAGETVDAGSMPMLGTYTCPRVYSPAWIDNDTLVVIAAEPDQTISPHNIWTVRADIQPGETGTRWLDTRREITGTNRITQIFAGEAKGVGPTVVAFRTGALATGIYSAPANDPASMSGGSASLCGDTLTCKLTSVDGTPDGAVTIISAYATQGRGPDFAAIYLSRGEGTFDPVLKLEGEAIGTAAISPDGRQITFDRARSLQDTYLRVRYGERVQCPCSIWRVESDGSGLVKIVDDGRAPDWSR